MPIQLAPTLYEEFTLDEIDVKYGIEDDPTTVTIKQATQGGHEQRQKYFARMERVYKPELSDSEFSVVQELSNDELKRLEIWLTLCGSNIEDAKGKVVFPSSKGNDGAPRLNMSKTKFDDAYDLLPHDVAEAIHEKVLELNPQWGPEGEEF